MRQRKMKRGWLGSALGCAAREILRIAFCAKGSMMGVAVMLGSSLGPDGALIGYAVAQQHCPYCERFARGLWSYAKCPHCDEPIATPLS
mgnify:CR=1 FL=1